MSAAVVVAAIGWAKLAEMAGGAVVVLLSFLWLAASVLGDDADKGGKGKGK